MATLETQKEQVLVYLRQQWPHESILVTVKVRSMLWVSDARILHYFTDSQTFDPALIERLEGRLAEFKNNTKHWYYNRYAYTNHPSFAKEFPYLSTWVEFKPLEEGDGKIKIGNFTLASLYNDVKSTHKDCRLIEKYFKNYETRHLSALQDAMRILPSPISQAILEYS